jgi:hypothetical chaperone protein
MTDRSIAVGLDFGTTNTVISTIMPDGERRRHVFPSPGKEGAGETDGFRSLICYWQEVSAGRPSLHHSSGPQGIADYLEWGPDQRLIMSMKSYLADAGFGGTSIFGSRFGIEDIVADFLSDLLEAVDTEVSGVDARVMVGRPVVFAGSKPDENLALERLQAALAKAGLPEVRFALEPEAAGARFGRDGGGGSLVLVGDFGGGTSDFSILKDGPGGLKPVAHAGLGLAGDRFDWRITDHLVAPHLGKGTRFKSFDTVLPVPWNGSDLTWHRLSLMNNPTDLRAWRDLHRASLEPETIARMIHIITEGIGIDLQRAVSSAKETLSEAETAVIALTEIGLDLEIELTRATFERLIADDLAQIQGCVDELLLRGGITSERIDRVFLTGGTAQIPAVRALFADMFGKDRVAGGGEFTSVADGLALLAAEM